MKKGMHPRRIPCCMVVASSWPPAVSLRSRRGSPISALGDGEDVDPASFAVKHHLAIDQGKQCVVFALAHALAGVELVAQLANENVAGDDFFTAVISLHRGVVRWSRDRCG